MPYVNETQYGQPKKSQEWMRNPLVTFLKCQFSMDLNTLMFIANQARLPVAQGPKQAPNLLLGPCYNYLGDHLIKDCPYLRQPRPNHAKNVSTLARYCLECSIKHLVSDCSLNLDKKGKATLNLLETILLSSGNESEEVKSLKVVTEAQALKHGAQQMDGKEKSKKSSPSTWKARCQRRMATKKCKEEKALDEQKSQEGKSAPQGDLVLADKVFEPLKMMLDSYEARLRPNQTNEE